ncbi:hypothetical protein ACFQV4_24675 [Streptomyces thermocarboxydus]
MSLLSLPSSRNACAAHRILSKQDPDWADGPNALRADTVTPLAPGAGVWLDTDGTGALGVALDADPAAVADALPRLGRLARLADLAGPPTSMCRAPGPPPADRRRRGTGTRNGRGRSPPSRNWTARRPAT